MPSNPTRTFTRLLPAALVAALLVTSAWASPKFHVMHAFAGGNDPWGPTGVLTLDSAGNLYGTSFYGGSTDCGGYGCGTVFRLTPKNGHWAETVLYNFPSLVSYAGASGPLAFDSAGNIYGIGIFSYYDNGQFYGGELFQVLHDGGSYTGSTLHAFVGGNDDGSYPNPGLVRDGAGNLYGSTQQGGDLNNNGVIFEFSPNGDGTWTETLLYQFGQGKSYLPMGPMIIDKAGNLYGTTTGGGAYGVGSVYKLSQANGVWTIESLYDFTPSPNYGEPPTPGGLVMDAEGNLYGNTQYDGVYGVGSLFKLTPTVGYWKFSLIHSFTGSTDGGYPVGGIAIDPQGNLYGTTYSGGLFQYGTVYKFSPGSKGSWSESVLHNFADTTDGYNAQGVILDSLGNIYGVTENGGAHLDGVAYEITQ
jgi:uncharacterized repeat protein (TIGR03803 family)